jgi:FixJ family two-component response regulator
LKWNIPVPQSRIVVCVEDDAHVREALGELLRSFGYLVESYASAEEFLESGPFLRVECLITDVQLGGMSGLQLQEELTRLGANIPTIIITAHATESIRLSSLRAGAAAFFEKPIVALDLVAAIKKLLARGGEKQT